MRDGEVENPIVSPTKAMASPIASLPVPEATTPASGSRHSTRFLVSDAEHVLQKEIRATALKNSPGAAPSDAFVSFLAFLDSHFLEVASDSALVFDSLLVLRDKSSLWFVPKRLPKRYLERPFIRKPLPSKQKPPSGSMPQGLRRSMLCRVLVGQSQA
jgi:hypothetical protein